MEIPEFEEEEDHNSRTLSIKQRKKKKAHKWKIESAQPSEISSKEKCKMIDASNSQPTNFQQLTDEEQGKAPTETEQTHTQRKECPSVPIIALVDYPEEVPNTRITADDSALTDQARLVEEIRAPTATLPVVGEPSQSKAKMALSMKSAVLTRL